jgi:predicted helicase
MKKAEIYYFTLSDELPREDKLSWFKSTRFTNIEFDKINPDDKGNWLNLTDNDFDSLMPMIDKGNDAIFRLSSLGVSTNRDEWVYDFSKENLNKKIQFFIKTYSKLLSSHDDSWNEIIMNYLKNMIIVGMNLLNGAET